MSSVSDEGTSLVHVDGRTALAPVTGGSEFFDEQFVRLEDVTLLFIGSNAVTINSKTSLMAGQLLNYGWGTTASIRDLIAVFSAL